MRHKPIIRNEASANVEGINPGNINVRRDETTPTNPATPRSKTNELPELPELPVHCNEIKKTKPHKILIIIFISIVNIFIAIINIIMPVYSNDFYTKVGETTTMVPLRFRGVPPGFPTQGQGEYAMIYSHVQYDPMVVCFQNAYDANQFAGVAADLHDLCHAYITDEQVPDASLTSHVPAALLGSSTIVQLGRDQDVVTHNIQTRSEHDVIEEISILFNDLLERFGRERIPPALQDIITIVQTRAGLELTYPELALDSTE